DVTDCSNPQIYTLTETITATGCSASDVISVWCTEENISLMFDGINDRCKAPHVPAYDQVGGSYTIEGHFKFDPSCTNRFPTILSSRETSLSNGGIYIGIDNRSWAA